MKYNEWKIMKLKDFVEINPSVPLAKEQVAKKVAMENVKEFNRKIKDYEEARFKSGSKFKNNDTLMARITPCLENGKTAFVDILNEGEVGFGSTEFFVLRAKEGIGDPKFVYYLSISDFVRNTAISSMTGTSGRQRAQKSQLLDMELKVPPLNLQEKIGQALSKLDEKIELNNRIMANLEELAQTLFKQWFIDFDFPNKDGEPYRNSGGKMVESEFGLIPEGWLIKPLDEIAYYQNGLAMQKYPPESESGSLPVIKIRELNRGGTDASSNRCSTNIKESTRVYDGDIIFSWSGTLLVKAWTGGNAGLNQHLFKITSDYYPKWLYYYWTLYHLRQFTSIAQDKATTMGHIKRAHLKEAKVAVPTSNEGLECFNSKMSPFLEKIIETGIEIRKLKALRDTLLPKLLSGEIEINEESEVEANAALQ